MDGEWNEYFAQKATSEPWTAEAQERRQQFFDSQTRPVTLQQHLLEQLRRRLSIASSERWPASSSETSTSVATSGRDVRGRGAGVRVRTRGGRRGFEDGAGVRSAGRRSARSRGVSLSSTRAQLVISTVLKAASSNTTSTPWAAANFRISPGSLHVTVGEVQKAAESHRATRAAARQAVWLSEPEQIVLPDVFVERDGDDYVILGERRGNPARAGGGPVQGHDLPGRLDP